MDVAGFCRAVAVGDDVLAGGDALCFVPGAKLRRAFPDVTEAHLRQIILPVVADGAGDVAPPHLSSRFSVVLLPRPGVYQHGVPGLHRTSHLVQGSSLGPKRGRERALGDAGVLLNHGPVLQLPLEEAAVQNVHLRMTKPGQQPGNEGRTDVAGLTRAVDDDRRIESQSQPGEKIAVGSCREQLGGDPRFTGSQRFGVEIDRAREMSREIGDDIRAHVDQTEATFPLPVGQLVGGDQGRYLR